jgi:hypothetical protein
MAGGFPSYRGRSHGYMVPGYQILMYWLMISRNIVIESAGAGHYVPCSVKSIKRKATADSNIVFSML